MRSPFTGYPAGTAIIVFFKIGGIATVIVHSLFMLIPLLITYGVSRIKRELALGLFPFIWVGYEFFDNEWQFAFPWLELGNTETYNLNRIRSVEFTGVHGTTFLICTVTVLLYLLISKIYKKKWKLYFPRLHLFCISQYWYCCSSLISILLQGFLRPDNLRYFNLSNSTKVVNTAIVQTNTNPFKKWGGDHDQLLDTYINGLHDGLKFSHMLVLHETATPFYFLEDINLLKSKRFFDLVDSSKTFLTMGIPHKYYYPDSIPAPAKPAC